MADTLAIAIGAFLALDTAGSLVEDALAGGNFASLMEELSTMAVQPFVGIIPIKADQYKMTRQVDVPESMVVTQYAQGKEFVVDSAAPHPRVWKMHGYITSLIPTLETGFVVKPTLILQKAYLDTLAGSRRPVLFKTTDGEFVHVLIQSLEISESPKSQTSFEIDITVKEFVYLTATSLPAGVVDFTALGAAAAASVPGATLGIAASVGAMSLTKTVMSATTSQPYFAAPIRGDGLSEEELHVSRTTPSSSAYTLQLDYAGDVARKIIDATAGGHAFRFDFHWNSSGESRYTRLTALLERTRQQTNVTRLSDGGADGERAVVTSAATQPVDLREYIQAGGEMYNKILEYNNGVIAAVLYALETQPLAEPQPAVRETWLAKTAAMIAVFEAGAWDKQDINKISACYGALLRFRDLLAAPPSGGLLDHLYQSPADIPSTQDATVSIRRTCFPLRNTYAALDAAERSLAWRCFVSTSNLGPRRSFILKKGARYFRGDARYNITVVAESCMANGNVGYSDYQFADKPNADQFPTTSLVVEVL